MNEVYSLRIGDMLFNERAYSMSEEVKANIVGIVYKMTPKYVYYAVCARRHGDPEADHFVTKDNKTKKEQIYKAIREGKVGISYADGLKYRRKIESFS